ncbi:hypothetical protein MYSTI_03616 [Myxococcus stipitatus DSM 14675]|uniref:Lipoprotein n=1 Tax=Myxococcus stipitatus (strain DSM 14675 / JCM 12634 / Mx s8) TaxID=1278073 RepID=L7UBJ4_MYXSD|nr:hypothetical protein MYSTI_03616 [Myxococcus stipitatus DSM 14675]
MTPDNSRRPLFRHLAGLGGLSLLLGPLAPGGAFAQEDEAKEATAPQVSCYTAATQASDDYTATQLCRGARSTAPAECFLRVQKEGSLTQGQALQLCQFATSDDDPASCFLQAQSKSFGDDARLLQLCQPPVTEFLRYCPVYVQ